MVIHDYSMGNAAAPAAGSPPRSGPLIYDHTRRFRLAALWPLHLRHSVKLRGEGVGLHLAFALLLGKRLSEAAAAVVLAISRNVAAKGQKLVLGQGAKQLTLCVERMRLAAAQTGTATQP